MVFVMGEISRVTTARLLQKNGMNCLLAESQSPGFGTTSGTTSHLNTLVELSYAEMENKFGEENARLLLKVTQGAICFL